MAGKSKTRSPLNLSNLTEIQLRDPAAPSPAQAYLNTLSPFCRRRQHTALNNLAYILSGGAMSDALAFPWGAAALRAHQRTGGIHGGHRLREILGE